LLNIAQEKMKLTHLYPNKLKKILFSVNKGKQDKKKKGGWLKNMTPPRRVVGPGVDMVAKKKVRYEIRSAGKPVNTGL